MDYYLKPIDDIINKLMNLKGVGKKTATRYAFEILLNFSDDLKNEFSNSILELKNIKKCNVCNCPTLDDKCFICNDSSRNNDTIILVCRMSDILTFEKIKNYNGKYHIIGEVKNFLENIDNIELDKLINRIDDNLKEIIIALDTTFEGEIVSSYIKEIFKDKNIKITKIAYGVPVGLDYSNIDELTITKALEGRQKI